MLCIWLRLVQGKPRFSGGQQIRAIGVRLKEFSTAEAFLSRGRNVVRVRSQLERGVSQGVAMGFWLSVVQ